MSQPGQLSTTLKANVSLVLGQIAIQVRHATKVRGRARSGYYKVAILLAATVVEALAHSILKSKLDGGARLPPGGWECYESHDLPASHQPTGHRLSICKRRQLPFQLTNKTDFIRVNEACRDLGVFSGAFFKKVDRVRTMRNRIHLQSLNRVDSSYTKSQLDSVGYVVSKLIDKVI